MTLEEIKKTLQTGEPLVFIAPAEDRLESDAEKQARTVPASAILELVTTQDKTVRVPIVIANAIIVGDLQLSHFVFEKDFKIEGSTLTGNLDFSMASFHHTASLAATIFEGHVIGRAAEAKYDLNLERCQFRNGLQLIDADVVQVFSCIGATFEHDTLLDRMHVGKAVVFAEENGKPAVFKGLFRLHSAQIDGHFVGSGCVFHSAAVLDGTTVAKNAFFDEVRFLSSARFTAMRIGDQITFRGARFESQVKFEQMVIEGAAFFQSTERSQTLLKEVSFGGTWIKGQVVFEGAEIGIATFFNTRFDGELLFDAVRFSGMARFDRIRVKISLFIGGGTTFAKEFRLVSSHINGPVRMQSVVFQGPASFENSTADDVVIFEATGNQKCIFGEKANFRFVRFGSLGCTGIVFAKEADFSGAEFGKLAILQTEFQGPALFNGLAVRALAQFIGGVKFGSAMDMTFSKIGGILDCSNTEFHGPCAFDGTRVGRQALFINASFHETTTFTEFRVAAQAAFQGSTFKKDTSFGRLFVGESLLFRPEPSSGAGAAVFYDGVTFNGAQVGTDANFRSVQFLAVNKTLFFDAMKVKRNMIFVACKFLGQARFISVRVAGQASFQGATFNGAVTFDGANISGRALFRAQPDQKLEPTVFGGAADFKDAVFGSTAEFTGSRFVEDVSFERTEFGGSAAFAMVRFEGPTLKRFAGAKFKQGAFLQGTKFSADADFQGIRVTGAFLCTGAVFTGKATFEGSTFLDSADFSGQAGFSASRFCDVSFSYCRFERLANFDGVTFCNLDLRETFARAALFTPASSAQFSGAIDARGFSYESIDIDWRHFLRNASGMVRLSPFARQPYMQLEQAFRDAGREIDADRIYLERRRVERAIRRRESKLTWLGDLFYWSVANYGIRPYRLALFALFFLFLGACVYRLPATVKISTEVNGKKTWRVASTINRIDAAKLSLRELLPIELPLAQQYEASEESELGSDYSALLRIVGWIIVPVGIAAITGMLRRIDQIPRP